MDKENINAMVEEIRSMKEGLDAQKRDFEAKMASYAAPINTRDAERAEEWRNVANAMKEKRAITLNGTGKVNLISEIIKIAQAKTPLLDKVRVFSGRDAQTNIPVWNPSIAAPIAYAEGATSVAQDSQAALGIKTLTPKAYVSILPVSDATLMMTGSNLEAELPSIFAEAFARTMHAGLVSGDGTGFNMSGLFTAAASELECAAAGSPKMIDLVNLALQLQDYYDSAVIVMNPAIYAAITASAEDDITRAYKEELIRNKSVEGVKVILTSYAPNATDAGKVVAVGGPLDQYALAVAQEVTIEPMRKVGDLNTYFQASAYFNGAPILPANFWALKAV
jgi:HK97 family phage major capsid protein